MWCHKWRRQGFKKEKKERNSDRILNSGSRMGLEAAREFSEIPEHRLKDMTFSDTKST